MIKLEEHITIADLINIWICLEKQALELLKTDKKSAKEIMKTHNKFIKLSIKSILEKKGEKENG